MIDVAHKRGLPVIVDAAAQVPPSQNLYRFIDMGADLVCISGGKGIRGPQGSGILCGRKDLIASAALQSLDRDLFEIWDPPRSLIPKERLSGKPLHGIGRSMKVGKESIIGLLVALEEFAEKGFEERSERLLQLLRAIAEKVRRIQGVIVRITEDYPGGHPVLELKIDRSDVNATEVVSRLSAEGIYVRDKYIGNGIIGIHSVNLDEETARAVGEALAKAANG